MTRQTYTSARSLQSRSSPGSRRSSTQTDREQRSSPTSDEPLLRKPATTTNLQPGLGIGVAAIVTTVGIAGAMTLPGSPLQISHFLPSLPDTQAPAISEKGPPASPTSPPINTPIAPPINTGLPPEAVYRKARDAVVTIDTPKRSSGSGVFINRSGMLLTNEHVVEQFPIVQVTLFDRRSVPGRVIQVDKANDLAVVQIDSPITSSCLPIDSSGLRIGQIVYALGSPLRMEQTFTDGVISRHNETGEVLHTAAIAPGSSGSPLLNDQGRIVGINRAVITKFRAMSIAVPTRAIQQLGVPSYCND